MFNINITENVLTKYKDVVVHHSSSEFISSRGQWSCQSPGPPGLKNFCAVQKSTIESSSNEEHLHDNDLVFIYIKYKPHLDSPVSQVGPTGVIGPSNVELRQSLSFSSPAVSCYCRQSTPTAVIIPSRDDVLLGSLNATGLPVSIT